MNNIMRGGVSISSTIQLEFDATQPLRARFAFGTDSCFTAYIAPKLVDDTYN